MSVDGAVVASQLVSWTPDLEEEVKQLAAAAATMQEALLPLLRRARPARINPRGALVVTQRGSGLRVARDDVVKGEWRSISQSTSREWRPTCPMRPVGVAFAGRLREALIAACAPRKPPKMLPTIADDVLVGGCRFAMAPEFRRRHCIFRP